MRGTRSMTDRDQKHKIMISKPAQKLLAPGEDHRRLNDFLVALLRFMQLEEFAWAYVGRTGACLEVCLGR